MRIRPFLAASLVGALSLGAAAPAQAVPAAPDLIISVRRDKLGTDLVNVGVRSSSYPPELLRSQLENLGRILGGEARGVRVYSESFRANDRSAVIVKGSCGVNGLIDRKEGRLLIAPIAQAFAGAPDPYTVHRMIVSFDGERPTDRTVARHQRGNHSDLSFEGRVVGSSVEFDVVLGSQNPARLFVNENIGKAKASPKSSAGFDPLTVALFSVAVVAAGALVYCLLVLTGRRSVAKS
jgi:hypothetical protein